MIVRGVLAVVLMVLSMSVQAMCKDSLMVEYGVKTHHHITDPSTVNEDNNFVGVSYDCWSAASFINSYGHQTYTVGYNTYITSNFSVGYGVIHGYEEKYFPQYLRVGNKKIIYVSFEATLWGSDIFDVSAHPYADNIGVKFRQFGEVSQALFIIKFLQPSSMLLGRLRW